VRHVRGAREVALLLTDVEGSTRLLVRHGQAGVAALGRIAELVSSAATAHGGEVSRLQGEGDSAVVLFGSTAKAVAAALDVNRWMAAEPWPGGQTVAMRSGVHVGEVTTSEDGVVGLEVHRCARVRALAGGGEVFLSDAALRDVGGHLPSSATVEDVGVVLLRGFVQPERVWRLVHPALRRRHGGVAGAGVLPGAFPAWRTSLVGRADEVAAVASRLRAGAVITLVGPGGVGKTRLASAVAAHQSDAACFVDLTVATSEDDVDAVVVAALSADASAAPRAAISAALAREPTLVVLDNCEHVIDGASSLAEHLAGQCRAAVLATSRAALRVADEDVVHVAPLSTGRGGMASELFFDRARSIRADLVVDDTVLNQVGAMTELLDGVPLAIELAAARVSTFSIGEIVHLLRQDAAGLGDGRHRGPSRHRSLRAAILWSVGLLQDTERAVLCRLSVLPGSFRLDTAAAVAGTGDGAERAVADAVHALTEQSLVSTQHRQGPTRYRLLEMVRVVGQEGLTAGERHEVLDRLVRYCIVELARLEGEDLPAAGIADEIAQDSALYTTAAEHALATGQTELGLRLVHDLFLVWQGATQRLILDRWMTGFVAQTTAPSRERGMVLRRQAIIANEYRGDDEQAQRLLDAAEADAVAVADAQLRGRVRCTRAGIDLDVGRPNGLDARLADAFALLEEIDDEFAVDALATLAALHSLHGRFGEAERLYPRAQSMNPHWFRRVQIELDRTWCALMMGRVDAAVTLAAETLDSAEQTGNADLIEHAIEVAARAALASGDVEVAHELFVRTLAFAREHDLPSTPDALAGLAIVAVVRGDLSTAGAARDELRSQQHFGSEELRAYRRLACGFVDQAQGDPVRSASEATDVVAVAERLQYRYVKVLGTELLAAAVASAHPARAHELLAAASVERTAIGATPLPLEPYRDAALRAVNARVG
jgi:predicted ATPase/class 3 adenylate cyclase